MRWLAMRVDDGKVVTAAGGASGLDMALPVITCLTAENVARSLEPVWSQDPKLDPFAS
ncbi:MAG: hypothetical protein GY946_18190 [bacterium]|nr:hypothetical protein [bacterium]